MTRNASARANANAKYSVDDLSQDVVSKCLKLKAEGS